MGAERKRKAAFTVPSLAARNFCARLFIWRWFCRLYR